MSSPTPEARSRKSEAKPRDSGYGGRCSALRAAEPEEAPSRPMRKGPGRKDEVREH